MLKKLWVLQLLLSNSSWKRSSSCRFRFDGLVKDTFCHNRLSLNYLKSFAWVHWWHAYSAASFPSGVSLSLIEVYAGLCVCVCLCVCVGILPVPLVPRGPGREKNGMKRENRGCFLGFHVTLGAERRAASVEQRGGGLGPGSGLWRLKRLMLSTANANDFGKNKEFAQKQNEAVLLPCPITLANPAY